MGLNSLYSQLCSVNCVAIVFHMINLNLNTLAIMIWGRFCRLLLKYFVNKTKNPGLWLIIERSFCGCFPEIKWPYCPKFIFHCINFFSVITILYSHVEFHRVWVRERDGQKFLLSSCSCTCILLSIFLNKNSFFFKVIIHNHCKYSSVEIFIWCFGIMQIRKVMQLKWYKTGSAAKVLSRQQLNRCHFVLFVMNISGAKFKKQWSNISRDIHYLVFYNLSCKPHDVITFLICILQNNSISKMIEYILFPKRRMPFFCIFN